jgi:hypothetical protein
MTLKTINGNSVSLVHNAKNGKSKTITLTLDATGRKLVKQYDGAIKYDSANDQVRFRLGDSNGTTFARQLADEYGLPEGKVQFKDGDKLNLTKKNLFVKID